MLWSIIGAEDHQGVIGKSLILEGFQNLTHGIVCLNHEVTEATAFDFPRTLG